MDELLSSSEGEHTPTRAQQLNLPESLDLNAVAPPPIKCDPSGGRIHRAKLNLPKSLELYTARTSAAERRAAGWAAAGRATASGGRPSDKDPPDDGAASPHATDGTSDAAGSSHTGTRASSGPSVGGAVGWDADSASAMASEDSRALAPASKAGGCDCNERRFVCRDILLPNSLGLY